METVYMVELTDAEIRCIRLGINVEMSVLNNAMKEPIWEKEALTAKIEEYRAIKNKLENLSINF